MDINTMNLLNEYMDILLKLTLAEYWFKQGDNKKKTTSNSQEYKDLCSLLERIVPLYEQLRELNINPPIWKNNKKEI